jgi:hypothetical protein
MTFGKRPCIINVVSLCLSLHVFLVSAIHHHNAQTIAVYSDTVQPHVCDKQPNGATENGRDNICTLCRLKHALTYTEFLGAAAFHLWQEPFSTFFLSPEGHPNTTCAILGERAPPRS